MGNIHCGTALTEPCIAESDPRYDADASINLEDQSEIWSKYKGLYRGEWHRFNVDLEIQSFDEFGYGPVDGGPSISYENFTVAETRLFVHRYGLSSNVNNPNSTGALQLMDYLAHSTHEKDGIALTSFFLNQFYPFDQVLDNTMEYSKFIPVANDTLHITSYMTEFIRYLESYTCVSPSCDDISATVEVFQGSDRLAYAVGRLQQVNQEDWAQQLTVDLERHNIPAEWSPVPMASECLVASKCPTNQQFCENGDPSCSISPYQEPDGKIKPGVVAAFVIGGILIALLLVLLTVRTLLKRQAKHNRSKFAARIAETMSIKKSARSLTPTELEKEFNKIDKKHGGFITKAELLEFIGSGKIGEINKRDFEALWKVMDEDNTGNVNFLEFCAYMARCHEEYDAAVATQKKRDSLPHSLAQSLAAFANKEEIDDISGTLNDASTKSSNPPGNVVNC